MRSLLLDIKSDELFTDAKFQKEQFEKYSKILKSINVMKSITYWLLILFSIRTTHNFHCKAKMTRPFRGLSKLLHILWTMSTIFKNLISSATYCIHWIYLMLMRSFSEARSHRLRKTFDKIIVVIFMYFLL